MENSAAPFVSSDSKGSGEDDEDDGSSRTAACGVCGMGVGCEQSAQAWTVDGRVDVAHVRTAEEGHAVVGAEEHGVHVGVPPQQLLERRLHARVLLAIWGWGMVVGGGVGVMDR
jgi:hypothetical protein